MEKEIIIKDEVVKRISYAQVGERTTVCVLTMERGYEILGCFMCKQELLSNKEFVEQKAFDNAVKMLEKTKARREERN
jgi:hypothetical protein